MIQNTELRDEVTRIRLEVLRIGGLTLNSEQLRLLCPDDLTAPQRFARIASIAQHEGWSFAFLPNGSVHFGAYAKPGDRTHRTTAD